MKNRFCFILLALFLGIFGVHNFYAGYNGRGLTQLLITCLLGWLVVPAALVVMWNILEIIMVEKDADGVYMN
jgi:TM2 domain-containing membrane protein YozV